MHELPLDRVGGLLGLYCLLHVSRFLSACGFFCGADCIAMVHCGACCASEPMPAQSCIRVLACVVAVMDRDL